ncbi:arginase family protein [Mesorhizobium sp. 1M-11]|uniref:arginase family protein n=1 Tax=Mesorhizobium sp. 1M-11 TaxID=1529006 RepID=UPI0006C758DD|nr:arginase family protein [Mesorhizobium sp. 1M-11]
MSLPSAFLGLPEAFADEREAKIVLFGVGHGSSYPGVDTSGYALAAEAIRAASRDAAPDLDNWDFDLGGPVFDGRSGCCIDAGDVPSTMYWNAANRSAIKTKTKSVVQRDAVPVMIGGDCSVTIPFLQGFEDDGPIWVVQIDAHIDWRDEIYGEHFGASSPMRRASEMPHVAGIVQVGARSVGSARASDVEDALRYGSRLVTSREVHAMGIAVALEYIPDGARVGITLDCDSIDPAVFPGVLARTPGGLTYTQTIDLIAGIARRGKLVGFNLVEFYPPADVDGLSALVAARIVVNVLGALARQG